MLLFIGGRGGKLRVRSGRMLMIGRMKMKRNVLSGVESMRLGNDRSVILMPTKRSMLGCISMVVCVRVIMVVLMTLVWGK